MEKIRTEAIEDGVCGGRGRTAGEGEEEKQTVVEALIISNAMWQRKFENIFQAAECYRFEVTSFEKIKVR